jgi:hypothetical protein
MSKHDFYVSVCSVLGAVYDSHPVPASDIQIREFEEIHNRSLGHDLMLSTTRWLTSIGVLVPVNGGSMLAPAILFGLDENTNKVNGLSLGQQLVELATDTAKPNVKISEPQTQKLVRSLLTVAGVALPNPVSE